MQDKAIIANSGRVFFFFNLKVFSPFLHRILEPLDWIICNLSAARVTAAAAAAALEDLCKQDPTMILIVLLIYNV